MISSKPKTILIVFALLLFTGFATAGCGQKAKTAWVNTNSMPGNTFVQHSKSNQRSNAVVYLGSNSRSSSSKFGPRDVNFDFKTLR